MKSLFILFFLLPVLASGQSAKFYADTTRLRSYVGHNRSEFDRALKMEWIIKGKKLGFGSEPIEVEPTKFGVDTVFFRNDPAGKWDTLICKIQAGSFNRFEYNACCDYFNVIDDSGKFIIGKVIFELKGTRSGKEKYLGSIDGSGVFMTQQADTIAPFYRSPMLPNSYNVEVKEVINCSGKGCQEAVIRKPDGSIDVSYHFRIVESIMVFHYLPISEEAILVTYDLNSGVANVN